MTTTASVNFQTTFDALVKKQFQGQMKLRGTCRTKMGAEGKTHRFPIMNRGVATPRIPQTDVVPMNVGHGFADAVLTDWNAADYSDMFDLSKLAFDERQQLVDICTMAVGRRLDQIILDACTAATPTATVPVSVGGATTGLNIDKILRTKRFLDDNGVPDDGRRYLVISAYALEQALLDPKVTSGDYNILRPLLDGSLKKFAGFNFIFIDTRDEGGLVVAANVRTNFAWHEDAIGLAIGLDIQTQINYIPEKTSTLINALFTAGAVVIDPRGFVKVQTQEN